jgi:DNA repair exonuclease SbcCD ATPase subunit
MRLLSATVRNYRIHGDCVVDFHDNPILIGGPNETGKSTLVEAIHRALFLRHNVGGDIQAGMVSTTHGGIPAVELDFEAGGRRHRLVKVFAGTKGTVTLTPEGGKGLAGDAAEEALARLLSTDGPITGKGAQNKLATQWAHLWIWQGKSGDNPAGQVRDVAGDLIHRLQESGGAVAQQSPLDAAVAARVAERHAEIHTKSGQIRSGSALDAARRDVETAQAAVDAAHTRVEATRADADQVLRSRAAIERDSAALATVRQSLKEVEERQRALEKLQTAHQSAERDCAVAAAERERVRKSEQDIRDKRAALAALTARLKPAAQALKETQGALEAARAALNKARKKTESAMAAVDGARRRRDLAEAYRRQLRSREGLAAKEAILQAIAATRQTIAAIEKQLARLPEVDARDLRQLRQLENAVIQAKGTLAAIATDVELLKGNGPATLGDAPLDAGQRRSIDEPTELVVGSLVVRISPGGGKDLEQARADLAEAVAALQEKLRGFAVDSAEAAAETVSKREQLLGDRKAQSNRLEALSPERTLREQEQLARELEGACARVEGLLQQVTDLPAPPDPEGAEAVLAECEERLRQAEGDLGATRSAVAAQADKLDDVENQHRQAGVLYQEINTALADTGAGIRVLIEQYGDDETRAARLQQAEAAFTAASAKLKELRTRLDALNPDRLEADHTRLGRSVAKTEQALQGARDDLAGAEARLQTDGRDDPGELLEIAAARLREARDAHAREQRHAAAIALLDQAFTNEQQALSEQFSQPLAGRINAYLQALFGAAARVHVAFQDGQLAGIELSREAGTGAFAFDSLSGGTREQVAAAVHLAIAELLAAGFDNALPVVFDDAFAHSDPARVTELQRMLDLAARRGLQVIILTCDPAGYASLGASLVELG